MTVIQDLDFVAPRDCELVAYGVAHTLIMAGERVRYFGRGVDLGWEFLVDDGPKSRRLQMRCWDPVLGAQLAALRDADNQPEALKARRDAMKPGRWQDGLAQSLTVNGIKVVADRLVPEGELRLYGSDGVRYLNPKDYETLREELNPMPVESKYTVVYTETFLTDRDAMVNEIIARQVEQGGVDTEGTRAQAERWCAWLCECVCEGMRATTRMSAYRMAFGTGAARADWAGYSDECLFRGKPLGRP